MFNSIIKTEFFKMFIHNNLFILIDIQTLYKFDTICTSSQQDTPQVL